jgi:hypothetical protein
MVAGLMTFHGMLWGFMTWDEVIWGTETAVKAVDGGIVGGDTKDGAALKELQRQ